MPRRTAAVIQICSTLLFIFANKMFANTKHCRTSSYTVPLQLSWMLRTEPQSKTTRRQRSYCGNKPERHYQSVILPQGPSLPHAEKATTGVEAGVSPGFQENQPKYCLGPAKILPLESLQLKAINENNSKKWSPKPRTDA